MLKNFRDKVALSGITVLMLGVALLILTFISAYGFLTQSLSIIASGDMVRTFGEALAPLIATCIRIMYLGVMGWVGSLLTIRGVTLIAHAPQMPTAVPQQPTAEQKPQQAAAEQKPQLQPQPQKPKSEKPKVEPKAEKPKEEKIREEKPKEAKAEEKPKEEVKPPELEIAVIPPETVPQTQPEQTKEPQKNNSSQQPSNP